MANAATQKYWKTAIADVNHDGVMIRGYDVLNDLVGMHIKSDGANTDNPDLPPMVAVGLPLRSEILDVLRQRIKLAALQPTF